MFKHGLIKLWSRFIDCKYRKINKPKSNKKEIAHHFTPHMKVSNPSHGFGTIF